MSEPTTPKNDTSDVLLPGINYTFVQMKEGNDKNGFLIHLPVGAAIDINVKDGALEVHNKNPDAPQAEIVGTFKPSEIIKQYGEQSTQMMHLNGVEMDKRNLTVSSSRPDLNSVAHTGDFREAQETMNGITTISLQNVQDKLTWDKPPAASAPTNAPAL